MAQNPLDLLPPSPMVLGYWKVLYANTKSNFREVAIKGFWDLYDPEGYSLWFCDYKYQDENIVLFMTMNKVGGFLQRMDLAHVCVWIDVDYWLEPSFKVNGLWLFRGHEIPKFGMDECYDMEFYEWTKVDITMRLRRRELVRWLKISNPLRERLCLMPSASSEEIDISLKKMLDTPF